MQSPQAASAIGMTVFARREFPNMGLELLMILKQTEIDRLADEYDRKLFPVTQPFFDDPILEATREFVVDFSTQPYKKSGSTLEALCPVIQPAMNQNSILLTFGKASTDDFAAMHAELDDCAKLFKRVMNLVGKDYPVSILIIYPDGDGHQMLEATNPKRFESKSQLMEQGIMAGAFFKESNFSSTFDPNLKPLRSPYPTFILRNTRRFDWVFVGGVPQLRDIYLKQFSSPPKTLREVHCPYTRCKNAIYRFFQRGKFRKNQRKYSDGGRREFWKKSS